MNVDRPDRLVAPAPAIAPGVAATAPSLEATSAPSDGPAAPGGRFAPDGPIAGATLFARYAYPPNERGYCGPPDSAAMLQYGAAGVVDRGLIELAKGFAGAWPYLEFISAATGIADPLDRRVVEAYWLGNGLLDRIDMTRFGNSLMDRFRRRAGTSWGFMAEAIPEGALPHHSFHVFGVYPWVGLLGADRGDTPLHVLQNCRIRWGQVVAIRDEEVDVLSRPLTWDGTAVGFGEPALETARGASNGLGLAPAYAVGDWVSLHWGWVCDRLSRRQLTSLRHFSMLQIDIVNNRVVHPGPRAALG
ncbi:MAG: DUF6390 family protein [Chloroflexota bacterium]